MRARWSLWALTSIAHGAFALIAAAEPVATRPDLRVGDEWVYQGTGDDDGKPYEGRWRRRIEEILPNGHVRVTPKIGGIDVFDASWNAMHPQRTGYVPMVFRFPLRVGDAWSFTSPLGAMTPDGRNYEQRGAFKVVAYEQIAVAAGTFDCFRIEGETHWMSNYDATTPEFHYLERWRQINWYCPDVGYMGKQRTETYIGGKFATGRYRTRDWQLVRYRRGPPPARTDAPQPASEAGPAAPGR